ncbi:sigma-70 family RNA polymerase sigma factor [Enterococcus canintestini]|uniref:RNA polymerase sigma factor n=1 Tax=Enterococcus canintestini TaxID=317010 RepID=UPI002891227E|nr:sigma-70 family RNA polymerase sigma factor [Enterococcus canintestini]MDT2740469.1 sigma-70 family RNA polymerase sigma factor [Enterococcus canintestini]
MPDKKIITLIRNHDFTGLEKMIEIYGETIIKTIRGVLSDNSERNLWSDCENEVFYTLWKKIPNYVADKSSLATFIMVITRNKAIDFKRKQQLQNRRQTDLKTENVASNYQQTDSPLAKEQFLELLDVLNEQDQLIFLHYYFYQTAPIEIAQLLEIKTSAVYNHLSRGKILLQNALKGELA